MKGKYHLRRFGHRWKELW